MSNSSSVLSLPDSAFQDRSVPSGLSDVLKLLLAVFGAMGRSILSPPLSTEQAALLFRRCSPVRGGARRHFLPKRISHRHWNLRRWRARRQR